MKSAIVHIVVLTFLFGSCQRSTTVLEDKEPPMIKVQYPLDNPALPRGFPLCMKVNVSDNSDLSSVMIEVNGGAFSKEYIPITRFIDIIEKYEPSPTLSGTFEVKIRAVDHAGNTALATIPFSINN